MYIPVLHNPNPELRIKANDVEVEKINSPEIQKLIDDMFETMVEENGVGLAATQIGIHLRIFVAETNKGNQVYINPEFLVMSDDMTESEEGCLSVPGHLAIVNRHKKIKATAYNRFGEKVIVNASGLLAIIFQHEIDHLDGKLILDRAIRFEKINNKNKGI
jgi:peptide deformylase